MNNYFTSVLKTGIAQSPECNDRMSSLQGKDF